MANLRKGVLNKIDQYLSTQKYQWEVIVVDDGSNDGSTEFVEKFASSNKEFKLITSNHCGKAAAITTGMLSAKGQFRLFTDMDQATPIEEIEKLLPFLLNNQYDIAIGSRDKIRKGAPAIRLFVSRSNIIVRKIIIGLKKISDTQCGFKLFSAEAAEKLFTIYKNLYHGFKVVNGPSVTSGFDVELLYLALKKNYKIKEVPVEWLYVESRRVSPLTDSIKGVLDLLRIRNNIIRGTYKNV